ncbi:MAG: T9SS type A sorting domain-containing protein [Bacteroidia bacterium]|nr:T9SS type A sorting domain-containing protein [Bacteroidia bacterium]
MKKSILTITLMLCFLLKITSLNAQSTYSLVYNVFQTNCTFSSCHDNASPIGGLDLQGSSSSEVYNIIVNQTPTNSFAVSQGYKLVYPGDPYRSFLFRKCNNGLAEDVTLDASEGTSMPQGGTLRDEEVELIRQWIIYGAPESGAVIDTTLIYDYYNGSGIQSVTEIPPKPDTSEGFQIHLGPFFLEKSEEIEYYSRYDLDLDTDLEVNRIDVEMGTQYSHHFIIYKYQSGYENQKDDGLRLDNAHYYTDFVTALQASDSVILPRGTAFSWPQSTVLDLNSHFINYSSTKVLLCETYVNVYTQKVGIASQIMKTDLGVNTNIWIPNDGTDYDFSADYYLGSSSYFYIWAMSSHTHQWGQDYHIFKRSATGVKGDEVFDASRIDGMPGGTFIGYDYQHPPTRFFQPFLQTKWNEGFVHEATFNNTGTKTVGFGETTEDEMMIMLVMYTDDTSGIWYTSTEQDKITDISKLTVFPNPFTSSTTIQFDNLPVGDKTLKVYNLLGEEVATEFIGNTSTGAYLLRKRNLKPGVFVFKIFGDASYLKAGKLIIK